MTISVSGILLKAFVVVDHVCEADVNVAVFSTKKKARDFIRSVRNEPYSPNVNARKYECLDVEEFVIDKP
jgi:hypothetical protein